MLGAAIDELALYSRAISAAEVAALHRSASGLGVMPDTAVPAALLHAYSRAIGFSSSATRLGLGLANPNPEPHPNPNPDPDPDPAPNPDASRLTPHASRLTPDA